MPKPGNAANRTAPLALFALTLLAGAEASASPELPVRFGARSLAMGGTGVAFVDDATGAALNPARLTQVPTASAMLTVAPFILRQDTPFSAARNQTSDARVLPLFFAGGALRLTSDWVAGAAAYVGTGIGAHYANLPEFGGMDMDLDLVMMEAALPIGFAVTKSLSVGVALRAGYALVDTDIPVDIGTSLGPARLEQQLSGPAFPGVLVGASYEASDQLTFAVAYRSKLTAELEGDGTVTHQILGGRQPVTVSTEFSSAHAFRAGAAWRSADEKLLVALDVSYALLDESNDTLELELDFTDLPGTQLRPVVPFEWKNSLAGGVGGEYWLAEHWAARAGYHLEQSATPKDHAGPLFPPPGLLHTAHLGAGFAADPIRVDVAGSRAFGGADVDQTVNGAAGHYGGGYWLFGASVSLWL